MTPRSRQALACVVAACLLLWAVRASAAEPPIPPSPAHWVTDNAGFLSSDEREKLDAQLHDYETQTGHQVIVWIGQTTGSTPLEEFTINAFTKWKVGRKGLDDGAVLFVFAKDRKLRIEVGYGLEPVLTDARSSEIIRDVIVPAIRAGDNDLAIQNGVDSMLAAIGGQQPSVTTAAPPGQNDGLLPPIIIAIVIIIFILISIRHPAFAMWMLYTLASGRGGSGGGSGWGGGGGGGFSGGGGMGGGGGASGGW